jgi:hypothetical protein
LKTVLASDTFWAMIATQSRERQAGAMPSKEIRPVSVSMLQIYMEETAVPLVGL